MSRFPDRALSWALAGILLLAGAPWAARANKREIVPELSLSQEYDSNAFNREDVVLGDFLTKVSPRLRFNEVGDWGSLQLQYSLDSQLFQRFSGRNSTNQNFLANGRRRLTRRLTLTGGANLRITDNVDRFEATDDLTFSESQSSLTTGGTLGARYQLTRRTTLRLDANGALTRNKDRTRFDTTNVGAQMSLQHILSRVSSVSLQLTFSKSLFENQISGSAVFCSDPPPSPTIILDLRCPNPLQRFVGLEQVSQDTRIDNQTVGVGGSWIRQWTHDWRSTLTLGVSSVTSSQEVSSSASLSGSSSRTTKPPASMTFTGGFSLIRESRHGRLSLGFNRQTRPSSGEGATLDVNSFSLRYRRQLLRRLSFDLSGSLQKSLSSFSGSGVTGSSIDTQVIRLGAGLSWRFSRQLDMFLRVGRTDQTTTGTRFSRSFNEIVTSLGFRYNFPIDLL